MDILFPLTITLFGLVRSYIVAKNLTWENVRLYKIIKEEGATKPKYS